MPGRRQEDISLLELRDMALEAERNASAARSESRAAKTECDRRSAELADKIQRLRDEITKKDLTEAMDTRKERKERWHEVISGGWKFIGAVTLSLISFAASLVLNWNRVEVFTKAHWSKAAQAQVPLMLDLKKKPRRHPKKKTPPIVQPEKPHEEEAEHPEE